MTYTIREARNHLSRLLKEAAAGNEVIVTRGSKPVAKIVAVNMPSSRKALAGAYPKPVHWDDNAFDPMTDEELIQSGLGYLLDVPLVPSPADSKNE
jgi:prevent-host-death family protein